MLSGEIPLDSCRLAIPGILTVANRKRNAAVAPCSIPMLFLNPAWGEAISLPTWIVGA